MPYHGRGISVTHVHTQTIKNLDTQLDFASDFVYTMHRTEYKNNRGDTVTPILRCAYMDEAAEVETYLQSIGADYIRACRVDTLDILFALQGVLSPKGQRALIEFIDANHLTVTFERS